MSSAAVLESDSVATTELETSAADSACQKSETSVTSTFSSSSASPPVMTKIFSSAIQGNFVMTKERAAVPWATTFLTSAAAKLFSSRSLVINWLDSVMCCAGKVT